ncbi:MAG: 2-keto-4-pentenoate hydratase [Dehalococcoidia bacterium]|nr:2-keto-4-pentenoate hydratase [Dehalococcoidia bacterium]
MKWARYISDGKTFYGIYEDEQINEVRGSPFEGYSLSDIKHKISDVKLLAPVIPPTFYAAGINYERHIREAAEILGRDPILPEKADIGYRAANAIIAHDEPVLIPKDATEKIQYEAELVVVIGKEVKNVSRENSLECILGYTIGNDVSERTWQAQDRTMWRAKNTDTFKPMGPWIETNVDLDQMETSVALNNKELIKFKTSSMIFGVEEYIHQITKYLTLHPGDVIWMGTDGASPNMSHGDICEITITGIGTLRNSIIKLS